MKKVAFTIQNGTGKALSEKGTEDGSGNPHDYQGVYGARGSTIGQGAAGV